MQIACAMMALLLAVALGVRSVLRSRCLGKCAACPHRKACGAVRAADALSKARRQPD